MRPELLLQSLASYRPLFRSEADFQHALAWEIQKGIPNAQVRLEVPIGGLAGRGAVDIVVRHESKVYGFELKYLKRRLVYKHDGEAFNLADTGEANAARYAICKDIARLEHMVGSDQIDESFLIVLANDPTFWRADSKGGTIDDQFKLSDGRTLSGDLAWGGRAGAWTKGAEATLRLAGEYALKWEEYVQLDAKNGRFRALTVHVTAGTPILIPLEFRVQDESRKDTDTLPDGRGRSDLQAFFRSLSGTEATLTFDEIEEYLGVLPASASKHPAWWSHVSSHAHAVWELEGFVASPELGARRVTFHRR